MSLNNRNELNLIDLVIVVPVNNEVNDDVLQIHVTFLQWSISVKQEFSEEYGLYKYLIIHIIIRRCSIYFRR